MTGKILLSLMLISTITLGMGSKAEVPKIDIEGTKTVVDANNQFCFELYQNLKDKEAGNIFFSPFSISMALAMVYEGARGETQLEMEKVFHFPMDEKTRHESFASVHQQINKKDARYKISTANALWIQKDYRLLPEYLQTIQRYYAGYATNVDFIGATEQARQQINSWVETKTNNKIKDLFPPGSLNPLSKLVITNAIYFKGNWVKQFDKNLTTEEDFRVNESKTNKVMMMSRNDPEAIFNYAETENLQILEMPYEGEDLAMIVLLPKDDDLKSLEDSLILGKVKEWQGLVAMRRVDVYIPRFTFKTKYFLSSNLSEMGMRLAFSEQADFSGIDGTKNLSIQIVVHQAFVDVNEEGTEAAAATGVAVGITSVGPRIPVFRADHPFIFMIQEKNTGNILFFGRVAEPEE